MSQQLGEVFDIALGALLASEPDALRDPAPVWARLREDAPIHRLGHVVLVSRYEDVHRLVHDATGRYTNRRDLSTGLQAFVANLPPADARAVKEYYTFVNLWMQRADFEDHVRLRRIAHRAFTPRRIAALRDAIERYVDELIEPLASHEVSDFGDFAFQLPLMVIVDMLGCPTKDRDQIRSWSGAIAAHLDRDRMETLRPAVTAIREFGEYVDEIVAGHRGRRHADDLISALMAADESGSLTTEELKAMFVNLLFGGHESTGNLLCSGLHALLSNPEQWHRLCEQPDELTQGAVEELLRFVAPVQWIVRVAAADHVLGDVEIRCGDTVFGVLAAANRDPAVFHEPDTLDITRSGQHLSFGMGPRFCLGASLARLEGQVAFSALARHFPEMELATDSFEYTGNAILRRLVSLPVRMGADHGRRGAAHGDSVVA